MTNRSNDEPEVSVGAGQIRIRGDAYEDLRPLVRGAVGVAGPFVECLSILTGLSVGWVNKKLSVIGQRYETKLAAIPEERRQLPALEIAATTIRGAAIAADTDALQEMFAELLAAASDTDRSSAPHPAFGTLICELESLDAQILALFPMAYPRAELFELEVTRTLRLAPRDSSVAVAISNLERHGLIVRAIERLHTNFPRRFPYRTDTDSMLALMREELSDVIKNMTRADRPVKLTPFGKRFIAACMPLDG